MILDELGQREDVRNLLDQLGSIANKEVERIKASHGSAVDPTRSSMGAPTLSDNAIRGTVHARLLVLCKDKLSLLPAKTAAQAQAAATKAAPPSTNVVEGSFGQTA